MTKDKHEQPFLVRGTEGGKPLEFTTGTRETAERLVAQLREQGLVDLEILEEGHA
jgi:hypothetical protein